jgi:hypothetical protein
MERLRPFSRISRAVWAPGLATLAGLVLWPAPADAAPSYGGRAFGASIEQITGLTFYADTGELPADGGALSASVLLVQTDVLRTGALNAATTGVNAVARSVASAEDVAVELGPELFIEATSVRAESEVTCSGVRGLTEIFGLTFAGEPIPVTGEANQTISLLGGLVTVVLNEQSESTGGDGTRSITVNAMRVLIAEPLTNIVIASTSSLLGGCEQPPADCHDFVTGGGWIALGNGRGNFGFNAGFKPNSTVPEIHFNYIDHRTRMHVKATSIAVYLVGATPTTRHMVGFASIDGIGGFTYTLDVTDNGEPGDTDVFQLSLSTGYSVGGVLAGGNIQLHRPCQVP